ncbi:MAG: sugar MFS transporter [Paludibacteraceae bacterium]|nr:sugar MFS transporter [Paludibacteraceae bacterium]
MSMFKTKQGVNYIAPFFLVASLFLLWGVAHSILDVLNKHFQTVLEISKAQSGLVQTMVYGGYFLMALPAGWIIRKWGYRRGIIVGLTLFAIGAFLFIPGSRLMSFPFFLFSLFVIGCGLTCLETSSNPYVSIMGDSADASRRLNLAQSFNGLGWIVGPLLGGLLIFGEDSNLALPYALIGCVVAVLAVVFVFVKLPEISVEKQADVADTQSGMLWRNGLFLFGILTLMLYVAAQTGINSFFINFVLESLPDMTPRMAAVLLSFGGMALFMLGRLLGTAVMSRVAPAKLLIICALGAVACMLAVIANHGIFSVVALCLCFFFESVMFPTIFSQSIVLAGEHTALASSLLTMSIVGGAIAPVVMGRIGENSISFGFVLPLCCFVFVLVFGCLLHKRSHK